MRYGSPDATELLAAVAEFLRDDVVEATSGRTSFHARVAANVVDMVGRELASRAAYDGTEGGLGHGTDAGLAAAVASGDLDDRLADVVAALRPAVVERLRVVNPRYESTKGTEARSRTDEGNAE